MSQLFVDNIKGRTGGAINAPAGIVVTGVSTFTGNVSVGGTLTYEDVTNIDSVGVITARSGINVTGGTITGDGSGLTGIDAAPSFTGIASGSLSNGSPVVITSDGKLTSISGTSVTESIGSMTTFESASTQTYSRSVCKTQNANQIVIVYQDSSNSSHGTAVVGTITGTSIVFGTPVVFEAANTNHIAATFDENAGRVVIVYYDYDNSNYGTAIVGTVSGTGSGGTINFGTPAVYHSSGTSFYNTIVYDSNAQKVCIGYRGGGNSNHATARVGTVDPSDNSITFGTEVTMSANGIEFLNSCFDSTLNKCIFVFRDTAVSKGKAVVGTISGTDVSFGTAVIFNNADTEYCACSYDTDQQKVVIAYRDRGTSKGTARTGTVSGTTMAFNGSETVVNTIDSSYQNIAYNAFSKKHIYVDRGNNSPQYYVGTVSGQNITFETGVDLGTSSTPYLNVGPETNTSNSTFVISFRDGNDNSYGKAQVLQTAFTNSNLTSENFIGFSDAAYTNGQNAKVQLVGSIDDAQTGLTTGAKYFVLADGSLSTTADILNVEAGTALSSTQILIR